MRSDQEPLPGSDEPDVLAEMIFELAECDDLHACNVASCGHRNKAADAMQAFDEVRRQYRNTLKKLAE